MLKVESLLFIGKDENVSKSFKNFPGSINAVIMLPVGAALSCFIVLTSTGLIASR